MPIYMDRHDVPDTVTPEVLARLHQEDLKIEQEFGCKGMTYWYDDNRKTAFCLIKAPNKQAIQEMHNHAHGDVPNSVIEVDETLVEAFLGRISDPVKAKEGSLNISDDAFRVIMVLETSNYLNRIEANQFSIFTQKFHNSVSKTIAQFEGGIVKQNNNTYLVSFKSVTNAILCALKIEANFKYITPKFDLQNRILKIGIDAGSPVTHKKELFEETITLATQMCEIVNHDIVISSEIKSLYENENRNAFIDKERIYTLSPDEQKFLTVLMDYIKANWKQTEINVVNFAKALGYSKSQLYRKLTALTAKSPNTFIRDYRLNQSLKLLHEQRGNISEIAYQTGFNSLAYFSKCFKDKFDILPSTYIQQHVY